MLNKGLFGLVIILIFIACTPLLQSDYNYSTAGKVDVEAVKKEVLYLEGNSKIEVMFLDARTQEPITDILNVLYVNGIKVCSPIESGHTVIYARFNSDNNRALFFEGLSPGYVFTRSKQIKVKQGFDYKIKLYLDPEDY